MSCLPSILLAYVTCPSQEVARTLAVALLEKRLVACAHLMPPHTSLYMWDGKFCEESEVILLLKTSSSLYDSVQTYIAHHHPYDIPCILALPVDKGLPAFLSWILEATTP